ncbi:hypothetical protein E2N91_17295 [Pseudomonas syringae pv. tomato]|nr:hypothetical protein E2N91_17295 [Pseudomonas syringae pv. tomato]TES78420.1 hypothetical protein E2N89_10340 [Pseudomonas syringae pv. tomato]
MTIVPMLRVGMHFVTLCVTDRRRASASRSDAERPRLRYHAERGSDDHRRTEEVSARLIDKTLALGSAFLFGCCFVGKVYDYRANAPRWHAFRDALRHRSAPR